MIGASIDALRRVGIEVEIVENGHFYLSGGLSEGYENYASIAVNASHKLVCAISGKFYTQKRNGAIGRQNQKDKILPCSDRSV